MAGVQEVLIVQLGVPGDYPAGTVIGTYNPNIRPYLVPNTAPSVAVGADQTLYLPTNSLVITPVVSDDGNPVSGFLTYLWTQTSGGAASFSTTVLANTTVTITGGAGTYVFRLTVDDGRLTGYDELTVVVVAVNTAPTVNAGVDQVLALPTNTATLTGVVGDDALPIIPGALTYAWTLVTTPPNGSASILTPSAISTIVNLSYPGAYTFRLTVTDGSLTSFDDVIVTLSPLPLGDCAKPGTLRTARMGAALMGYARMGFIPVDVEGCSPGSVGPFYVWSLDEEPTGTWTTEKE